MTELVFKGKEFAYNHHLTVPFRPLEMHAAKGIGAPTLDGNLIIHGDNLHALKALLPTHAGKVDCIFIDPPYNTGNEGWCYNDNVNSPMIKEWLSDNPIGIEDGLRHDKWCAMMWPRLRLLFELLSDRGALFISIDDNELGALVGMLAEIFSHEPTAIIPVVNNLKGRNDKKNFARAHEYVVIFDKGGFVARGLALNQEQLKAYRYVDGRNEKYSLRDLRKRGGADTRELRPKLYYPIYFDAETGKPSLERVGKNDIAVFPHKKDGTEGCWKWGKATVKKNLSIVEHRIGNGAPGVSYRVYLHPEFQLGELPSEGAQELGDTEDGGESGDDEAGVMERTSKSKSFWIGPEFSTDGANKLLKAIMLDTGTGFDYPKSVPFVERILALATDEDSLVLDSFAGSGTTAHAVLEANRRDGGNRKFILVEMEDYADKLTAERVRRVIKGYKFKGTQKTELLREKLNWRTLEKAGDLVHKVDGLENLEKHRYDKITKQVKDAELIVTGEKTVTQRTEGLGGAFTYCTLGPAIDMDALLTGKALPDVKAMAALLYHTATARPLAAKNLKTAKDIGEGVYHLGEGNGRQLWLIYRPDLAWLKSGAAALSLSRARAIAATHAGDHLVFAPAKFVSRELLAAEKLKVEYAPLPFALYRVETA